MSSLSIPGNVLYTYEVMWATMPAGTQLICSKTGWRVNIAKYEHHKDYPCVWVVDPQDPTQRQVPFVTAPSLLDRFHVVDDTSTPPPLRPGDVFAVPPPVPLSQSGALLTLVADAIPCNLTGLIPLGLEHGTLLKPQGAGDDAAVVSVIGLNETGLIVVRTLKDNTLTTLTPGSNLNVVDASAVTLPSQTPPTHFQARAPSTEAPSNSIPIKSETKSVRVRSVPVIPECEICPTHPYLMMSERPELVDIDPDRCRKYFDVVPGQRFSEEVVGRGHVVGLQLNGQGKVNLILQVDRSSGGGTFKDDTITILDEPPKPLKRWPGVLPPRIKRPTSKGTQVFLMTPTESASELKPTLTAMTIGGMPIQLDVRDELLDKYGVRSGQIVSTKGVLQVVYGIGADPRGEVHLWLRVEGKTAVGTFRDVQESILYDDFEAIQSIKCRKMKYYDQSLKPDMPLQCTFPFQEGTGSFTDIQLYDVDEARCKAYFDLVPGTRVDGKATTIGMRMDKGKVCMFFHVDSNWGAGKFRDGTTLDIEETAYKVQPCTTQPSESPSRDEVTRTVTYKETPERSEDPLQATFPYRQGLGATKVSFFDADAERCKRYFGIEPGERVRTSKLSGMLSTCIGMKRNEAKVELFFHPDGRSGAATFSDGTELHVVGDKIDVKPAAITVSLSQTPSPLTDGIPYSESVDFSPLSMQSPLGTTPSPIIHSVHSECHAQALEFVEKRVSSVKVDYGNLKGLGKILVGEPEMEMYYIQRFVQRECPMGVWFKPMKFIKGVPCIDHMTSDTHLRNLFEVGTGNANTNERVRRDWEEKAFGPQYGASCHPSNRPKYGLINMFNDPAGPQCPGQYGDCFLVLKGVRQHVTVTPEDSLNSKKSMSTLNKGLAAVISDFMEEKGEHEKIAQLALGRVPYVNSRGLYYKEIQIHGQVSFQDNVSHVIVNESYKGRPQELRKIAQFCRKNGAWLVFPSTLRRLANLRLKSAEELANHLRVDLGITNTAPYKRFTPCVLCGPQTREARKIYDVLCNVYCMGDAVEVDDILRKNPISPSERPTTDVPGEGHSFEYNKVPLRPEDPLDLSFPYKRGVVMGRVKLHDADPDRCKRYFGIVPGQRVTFSGREATCIGMDIDEDSGKVEMFFHVEGSSGAGVFSDGTTLHVLSGKVEVKKAGERSDSPDEDGIDHEAFMRHLMQARGRGCEHQ
eukprot:PhF_6_TR6712/c0_g1_i1/m.9733